VYFYDILEALIGIAVTSTVNQEMFAALKVGELVRFEFTLD
jgi:hypothetical protein